MDPEQAVVIRPSTAADFDRWFALIEAVAAEGRWIGSEAPLERDVRHESFERYLTSEDAVTLLAEIEGRLVGMLEVEVRHGLATFGMLVDVSWRGRGVGSALLEACISWAGEHDAHKVSLQVWPHNVAAIALYRKFGFREEALLRRHYRRRDGALWDALGMGLVLDETSPGNPFDLPGPNGATPMSDTRHEGAP